MYKKSSEKLSGSKLKRLLNRHVSLALWVHILFFLLLVIAVIGCSDTPVKPNPTGALVTGGVVGALVNKTASKIENTLQPEYLIHTYPMELCSWQEELMIECRIVPCSFLEEALCVRNLSFEQFKAENPRVPTLDLTLKQFSAILNKCNKNPELCLEYIAQYSGEKVIVNVKEDD